MKAGKISKRLSVGKNTVYECGQEYCVFAVVLSSNLFRSWAEAQTSML